MNFKNIMLNELGQTKKATYWISSFVILDIFMSRKVKLIEPERVFVFARGWLEMEREGT